MSLGTRVVHIKFRENEVDTWVEDGWCNKLRLGPREETFVKLYRKIFFPFIKILHICVMTIMLQF